MSKAQRLRLGEVRDVYRLVGECRELGADSLTWRRHALDRLRGLIGAQVGIADELSAPIFQGTQGILQSVDLGWDSPQAREQFTEYASKQMMCDDPFLRAFARLPGRLNTCSPEQLVGERYWHPRAAYNEYFLANGIGVALFSQQALSAHLFTGFSFFRPVGAARFARRERCLVHLFHEEIGPLIGKALAGAREPGLADLAPRVRQTLDCLLEGDSEKQVAARLRLSVPTVHEYVGTLYQYFGVSSRAELLALFLRRFRGSPQA